MGATAAHLVRSARGRRGLSQRALAARAGVPQSTVSKVESGRQQPTVAMLERLLAAAGFRVNVDLINDIRPSVLLAEHRDAVAEILTNRGVQQAWVFGSVARGDDTSASDLDILVELAPDTSFADYVDLADEISALLGCPVDVVTTKELGSNDLFRRRVTGERRRLDDAA
ncbi:MAG: helix-turn-helix domain-containing protein [Jiangellaceae bacterium]